MSRPVFVLAVRLRLASTLAAGAGLIAVVLAVGALFPAVGRTIGALRVPPGVATLLGGAQYGTVTGWFRSEIGAVYGPLLAGAMAISAAAATLAGEEESGILALVLAHPLGRRELILAKSAAVGAVVTAVAACTWVGLLLGVAAAGGGIPATRTAGLSLQLALFGWAVGGLAIAVAAATGRRGLAVGAASSVAVLGWLANGLAPLVGGLGWLRYLSLYHYYAGHDPLAHGVWVPGLAVLGAVTAAGVTVGVLAFARRDLRG